MTTPTLPDLPIFRTIAEAAHELGQPAYVIGGYVRDLALRRDSKDIDVVTVGDGIKLAEAVGRKLPGRGRVTVFKNFGTAMLPTQEAGEIEFVGARKESYRAESRKPEVEAGTLEDDLARRDFTINALGLSLNAEDFGALVDRYEGMKDLAAKTIRTPLGPDITFSDDPLRMLRAIRFASQLNFDIEPDTYDAISRNKERIKIVSQERITIELNKIVASPVPSYGFKLLFQTGLLQLIFPKMALLHGVDKVGQHAHKDNFYHTLQVLDNVAAAGGDLWLRWAAILHDIAKPATKRYDPKVGWTFHGHEDKGARWVPSIFTDLKLPLGEEMRMVQKLVRLHLRPIALSKDIVTDSAVRRLLFEAGDDIDRLMLLCRADITSKDHQRKARYLHNFDIVEEKLREIESKDHLRNFKPVITGEVIMETFGLKPSRQVGELKEAVLEAILEGEVPNEWAPAYQLLLARGAALGLAPVQA
ncbi:HD domain-containing protein [Hymenobacter sp. HMF4947]|uniref:HD domain-containing protein n=1 Tax=Hymenobacter ginkgonis TaxID=2682976 RepID=A0A7K1TF76_9BACT|nr:HD domain-containing protein [Hymenobacter ginkgonis]MVN77063.1 HD domain-containing protein [Hymenobacter ginkgonis]